MKEYDFGWERRMELLKEGYCHTRSIILNDSISDPQRKLLLHSLSQALHNMQIEGQGITWLHQNGMDEPEFRLKNLPNSVEEEIVWNWIHDFVNRKNKPFEHYLEKYQYKKPQRKARLW